MPPLITREEALRLGELEDHAAIEALVERAWQARLERFDDSTDMCSLVNAKSGGCAEDCGFCAQSRFAEAETPLHAMMSAEQILEHAKAAEAAGAHRFCMVTQGQGLSKRDFDAILEGARLVSEQTNLKRCASIGHMSVKRAKQLKEAGIQRVHHNVETARSYYPEVSSTVQYDGRLRTIEAVREAGLETCVGGILNLGETREQRVEMAFELAAINPTSVPINLLNPRPGTKFGDRDYMDPWEAVKWIAIFRLILPEALFRLCGGRTENLADLQRLAVRAGINGVMLGNFLTTLGNLPEEDHAMFEEQGLNIAAAVRQRLQPAARQPLRLARRRDARRRVGAHRGGGSRARRDALGSLLAVALPQEVLRAPKTRRRAQPRAPVGRVDRSHMLDLQDRLDELKSLGLYRRMRMVSGPQGPRVVLDGKPVLLLCSNNYLGLADHPRVREAAADAAMRWGAGAGASRLVSGNMTLHRRLEERLATFNGTQSALLFGSGYLANLGVVPALARRGEIVYSDELNHASIVDGCRLAGAETFVYRHADVDHLEWGLRNADGRAALIVTDGLFSMDGDVAPLVEIVELARHHDVRVMVDDAHGTGAFGPGGRGAVAEAGLEGEVDVIVGTLGKALGSYGAFVACDHAMTRHLVNSARSLIFSTGLPPAAAAAAMAALELLQEQPRRVERLADNAATLRAELAREGFDVSGPETQIVPLIVGDAGLALRICEAALEQGVFAQAIRPPTVPDGTSRLRLAVMASHTRSELRDAARILARAALRNGLRPSSTLPVAAAQTAPAPAGPLRVFDGDAEEPLPKAA